MIITAFHPVWGWLLHYYIDYYSIPSSVGLVITLLQYLLQHSIQCGAGSGMFLLINSSIVVVVRGPRATLWGWLLHYYIITAFHTVWGRYRDVPSNQL